MATYRDIKGFQVQSVDTDPDVYARSWAAGGTMNSARTARQSGGTGNDNAIVAGGYNASSSPPTAPRSLSESYNGTAWTETSENNDARQFGGGAGTNTNAIIAGGDPSSFYTAAETWNGSSWTEAPNMNTNKNQNGMTGNATAALTIGGGNPSAIDSVESWNGSAWTETSYDLNTAKKYVWATGTTTAALASGTPTTTESLDGTTWTEVTESSTNHSSGAASGARDDCLVFGGDSGPGQVAKTELWNGSSWTEGNDLATARSYLGGTGNTPNSNTALAFGGSGLPAETGATEEWGYPSGPSFLSAGQMWFNSSTSALKVYGTAGGLPAATWSSGGNYPASIYAAAGFGTQDSAVVGSYAPGGGTEAASYNGTSWTVITDVSTDSTEKTGFGESNSSGYLVKGSTENWNGSSWTEVADATNSFSLRTGFGAPGSAIVAAGESPPSGSNLVESWDGTSWTEVSELNTARYAAGGGGSGNTSGIIAGGTTGSNIDNSETWDGSSWTEGGNLNTARHRVGSAGKSVESSLIFGGESITGKTESYNGTAWTELTDMTTARIDPAFGNIGVSVAALAVGGRTPPATNVTEEFTASAAVSTVTTSQT